MKEEFERMDRVRAVAGTQYQDEDGKIQKVVKVPRQEQLREDEQKAKEYREAHEKAIEEAERQNKRAMERLKYEFNQITKNRAIQKYNINKVH